MWMYISFRALLTLILSLIISAWFGEKFIKFMKRRNISETARDASIDPFSYDGRHHHCRIHPDSRPSAGTNAKHLSAANDRDNGVAGLPRLSG